MKTVSIIVPVYNVESYISTCLKSILSQTYKSIEVILIDDNSTDNTYKIIEEFAKNDSRIKIYSLSQRHGVGAVRNIGIEHATGDYIYFVDGDDYIPTTTIELLVEHIGQDNMLCGKIRNTFLNNSFAIVYRGLFNPKTLNEDRYDLINNYSALNFLISRDFIKKNHLRFSENVSLYTDLYFMLPALREVESVRQLNEGVYFKRRRNDPITNPSLSQMDSESKIRTFLNVYKELKKIYNEHEIQEFLDNRLLNFYRKEIIIYFRDNVKNTEIIKKLIDAIKEVDFRLIKSSDYILKKEATALYKGKIKAYKRIFKRHQFLRELREGLKSRRKFYIFLYQRFFIKLPIKKNLIFFESFLGKNYSDSPKYIYEYLSEHDKKFKFVWSFNETKEIPGKAKQVKRFSLRYFYYLARSKYWVSNSRLPRYLTKRKDNIYLQTWHGTPLKRLVFDMEDVYSADPRYKENFYHQSRRWDYLSSPNKYSSEIFRRAFKFEKEMLEFGYPRNDILYNSNNDQKINELKEKMGIPKDKNVILYAPTWRDDDYFARGKYNFELQLNLQKMKETLGDDYIVLLRMHYFIANKIALTGFENFVYDFSTYDDIAELYLISDILITDYSSVFFDFANLKRPILFYVYDLEKYRDQLRGFYIDIEKDLPGPLLKTTDEVLDCIVNIEDVKVNYQEKYDLFYNRFCEWDDGKATERTVNKVFK